MVILIIAVLVLGTGSYLISSGRFELPYSSDSNASSTPTVTNIEEEPPVSPPTTSVKKTPPPPPSQTFDSSVHDVKYFYDTVQVPEEGYVRSGYKNEVTIRGRLVVTKTAALCETAPCPQPDSSDYMFSLENAQAYIQNEKYRISIRGAGNPVVKNLKEGEIYVIQGTLEHWFMNDDKVSFSFDPVQVK